MRVAHQLRAIAVLREAGMLDPRRPVLTATTALAMRRLGPIAGAAHIAARRNPADLALIDELGRLTYGELDRRANALARGWSAAGVRPGDVIGVLCRDHRGAVASMIACGKYGVRLVLLNTGFSKVQLADVALPGKGFRRWSSTRSSPSCCRRFRRSCGGSLPGARTATSIG